MKYVIATTAAYCGLIAARTKLNEALSPWQFQWMVWVVATGVSAGCIGYAWRDYLQQRREKRKREHESPSTE